LPGGFVMILPLDKVSEPGLLIFIVDVKDLLKLSYILNITIIVAFGDAAGNVAALLGVDTLLSG
jgi:hypothetical protein